MSEPSETPLKQNAEVYMDLCISTPLIKSSNQLTSHRHTHREAAGFLAGSAAQAAVVGPHAAASAVGAAGLRAAACEAWLG